MDIQSQSTSGASDLKIALDRIRKKLLDLSRRNRLLNHRPGRRSLQIVDELPDQVFKALVTEGAPMYFAPLAEPDEEEAASESTENLTLLDLSLAESDSSDSTKKRAQQNDTRTQSELPRPLGDTELKKKHVDEFLQTRLYARDLEKRLKHISGDAQTAIEESGSNILYLVLGFLEWYEDDNSSERNRAPLILVPVTLERGKFDAKAFRYRYSLSYSGEDITPNLSLAEKLRQDFGIALPEFDEELKPEIYFESVSAAIADKRGWKVAREILLGMFSFGKLLMYLDLDPARWPGANSLTEHSIIGRLFEGSQEADGNPYGETYQIDADPQAAAITLVVDADSSQHSAIIDAISGRNLVIEGPPGTGKSQTITNLIGVALWQGKSVLFVSEKLAALEVVRRNLDNAGLGDFCLELHSHKTQKQKLLKDIEARLRKKYNRVDSHRNLLNDLNRCKKELQDYVEVINSKYGDTGLSVYDILWRAERARTGFATPPRLQIVSSATIAASDIAERIEALTQVKEHWSGLDGNTRSAWRGVELDKFHQIDAAEFGDTLTIARDACANIVEACGALPSTVGSGDFFTLGAAIECASSIDHLRQFPRDIDQSVVALLALPDVIPLVTLIESARTTVLRASSEATHEKPRKVVDLGAVYKAIEDLKRLANTGTSSRHPPQYEARSYKDIGSQFSALEEVCCTVASIASVPRPEDLGAVEAIFEVVRLAAKAPIDLVNHFRPSMLTREALDALDRAEQQSSKISIKKLELSETFDFNVVPDRQVLSGVLRAFQKHETRLLRLLSGEFRGAKATFLGLVRDKKAIRWGTCADQLNDLIQFLDTKNNFARNQEFHDRFGSLFAGVDTDWKRLRTLISWTDEVGRRLPTGALLNSLVSTEHTVFALANQKSGLLAAATTFVSSVDEVLGPLRALTIWISSLNAYELPATVKHWLLHDKTLERTGLLSDVAGVIRPHVNKAKESLDKLRAFGTLHEKAIFGTEIAVTPLAKIIRQLEVWRLNLPSAGTWAEFCRAANRAKGLGLEELLKKFAAKEFTVEQLPQAYEFALYSTLAREIVRKHPLLCDFTRINHERVRTKFAEIDRQILKTNRDLIAYEASMRKAPAGQSAGPVKRYTQMGLIRHEVTKKKRHVPIRQLVSRAGNALQAIKPCFMMGPLSVAQYLPPGSLHFDLVVMDEASQVKPEEALGAIARGTQFVIVGDPKQLPPTNFFDRLGEAETEEDDELALDDSESILDICMQAYRPVRRLCWHYRSEHESLINFSNCEFYDKDLILFPSPVGLGHGLGVRFHYIKGADYENRRNKREAEAVARAVIAHAQHDSNLTLGVGTFNLQQKELIEDYLERFRTTYPVLDDFIRKQSSNGAPFFVKNLENIQGDERDVIFISTTYGPDRASGRVMQRFGPINSPDGWRRLNVIVTRAKKRTEVFSSMRSTDVQVQSTSSRGVRALRGYLEYVEKGGKVIEPSVVTGKEPDSPFEESVAHVLNQAGYKTAAQIGVAGYFIDLAVMHATRPGEYILGVECDGATYHSSFSVRDRDRLRQDVLESRGWNIHRIWSTDWFNNRDAEIARLLRRIEELVRESGGVVEYDTSDVEQDLVSYVEEARAGSDEVSASAEQPAPVVTERKSETSSTEARQKLLELYRNRVLPFFPDSERGILRKEMLEAFLRNRPTTPEEFRDLIPLRFRQETDPKQMQFLPEILQILELVTD
jgi:very-short-patch-repair endonuclease